jgi:energy-coupling factor transport system ATP-binding protein
MVLDEPTSFLDPVRAEEIFRVIHTLNEKLDITVILVEHKLDLTSKYADRIIIMDEGKIVLEGKPREVFDSKRAELIGVGFPKATVLYHLLKKRGIPLRETPISAEEASTLLREVLA